jgi:hypothetical protein
VNRVNRKNSHISWLSSNQSQYQTQPTELQQQQTMSTHKNNAMPTSHTKTLAFFSVNSNPNAAASIGDSNTGFKSNQLLKNPLSNLIEAEMNSNKETRSLSSSSKFSSSDSSSSSSSVSPPLAGVNTNTAATNLSINSENQKIFNKFNNKMPFTTTINDLSKKNFQNQNHNNSNNQQTQISANINSWDSSSNKKIANTNIAPPMSPLTQETNKNYTNFTNNNNNNYYPKQPQPLPNMNSAPMRYQNSSSSSTYGGGSIQQNNSFPNRNNLNSNRSTFSSNKIVNTNIKNALGVSTNEVLPLNKPIIPLKDVLKTDNKHAKSQTKTMHSPNDTLNSAQPQPSQAALSSLSSQGNKSKVSIILEETKVKIHQIIDDYLNECISIHMNSSSDSSSTSSSSPYMENGHDIELLKETSSKLLKQFNFNSEQTSEMISLIIVHTLSKSDLDRLNMSKLFIEFHETISVSTDMFMNGFKLILQNLSNLESEYHFVKSNISLYAARAVCDQIISLSDLAQLMKYGAYYPLFFLCMQNMHKLKTPEWLRNQLEKSKINLVDMLPAGDRNKDRLIQILEDRELSFVYPMLKIESTLFEKIQSNLSSKELKEWIELHVDADIRMSIGFIQSLVSCIVKNAAENSLLSDENSETNDSKAGGFNSKVDKLHVAKQKESIEKYQVKELKRFFQFNNSILENLCI